MAKEQVPPILLKWQTILEPTKCSRHRLPRRSLPRRANLSDRSEAYDWTTTCNTATTLSGPFKSWLLMVWNLSTLKQSKSSSQVTTPKQKSKKRPNNPALVHTAGCFPKIFCQGTTSEDLHENMILGTTKRVSVLEDAVAAVGVTEASAVSVGIVEKWSKAFFKYFLHWTWAIFMIVHYISRYNTLEYLRTSAICFRQGANEGRETKVCQRSEAHLHEFPGEAHGAHLLPLDCITS